MPSSISFPDLKRFLIAAKQATYAAQSTPVPNPLLPDSKQLEYSEGPFLYRDVYVGLYRFVGQEIVYLADRAIWSMSYSGGLSPGVLPSSAGPVYALLRKALRELPPELPLRGPPLFEDGRLAYSCQCSGTVEQFHGFETVTDGGVGVYELHFAGGVLA